MIGKGNGNGGGRRQHEHRHGGARTRLPKPPAKPVRGRAAAQTKCCTERPAGHSTASCPRARPMAVRGAVIGRRGTEARIAPRLVDEDLVFQRAEIHHQGALGQIGGLGDAVRDKDNGAVCCARMARRSSSSRKRVSSSSAANGSSISSTGGRLASARASERTLHAARQFARQRIGAVGKADQLQRLVGARRCFGG